MEVYTESVRGQDKKSLGLGMEPKLKTKQPQYKKMHQASIQIMVQVWVPIKQYSHEQNKESKREWKAKDPFWLCHKRQIWVSMGWLKIQGFSSST